VSRPGRLNRLVARLASRETVNTDTIRVDPALGNHPLAGVFRRALAMILDLALCVLIVIPVYLFLADRAVRQQAPGLPSILSLEPDQDPVQGHRLARAMVELAWQNTPAHLPPGLGSALSMGDTTAVDSLLGVYQVQVMLAAGSEDAWIWKEGGVIRLSALSLMGSNARTFGLVSVILVYFTLLTWVLRGFTPGKWLAGVRVLRLDGRPMRLWDGFGRAGGYSASVSTLMLGFLEVFWENNRMCLHDRIVGTVVLRHPRLGGRVDRSADPEPAHQDPA
jgi:uncharacterized RDD family membrane protein YckC